MLNGAQIILDLTAWVSGGRHQQDLSTPQVEFLMPTRAAENGVWIACCDKSGIEAESIVYAGRSRFINPSGETVAALGPEEDGVLTYDVPITDAAPRVTRRPELYDALSQPTESLPVVRQLDEAVRDVAERAPHRRRADGDAADGRRIPRRRAPPRRAPGDDGLRHRRLPRDALTPARRLPARRGARRHRIDRPRHRRLHRVHGLRAGRGWLARDVPRRPARRPREAPSDAQAARPSLRDDADGRRRRARSSARPSDASG